MALNARYDRWLYHHCLEEVISQRFTAQLRGSSVVHRFGGNPMAAATVAAGRTLDMPVVITPFAHPGQWDDDEISARTYRGADLVVATTRTDAATYEALGVPSDRLVTGPPPTLPPGTGGGEGLRACTV